MQISPFLPGLILALTAWILPPAIRLLQQPILSEVGRRASWLPGLAPWLHSIAPPYLGLVLGWISGRDAGLSGQTPAEWILGAAAAILLGLPLGRLSVRFGSPRGWKDVRDEARWSLYRAAVWPLAGILPLAVAAAFAAACAEFVWGRKFGGEKVFDEAGGLFLVHALCSAALFLLAHNIFLAMLMYLTAVITSTPDIRLRLTEMVHQIRK
jgi:hypothetical protein